MLDKIKDLIKDYALGATGAAGIGSDTDDA